MALNLIFIGGELLVLKLRLILNCGQELQHAAGHQYKRGINH